MNDNLQFRTAAFGGFHKQDVLNYLERSARDHADKVAALQKELAEAKDGRASLEEAYSLIQKGLTATEEENDRLVQELTQREGELAQTLTRAETLEAQLTALQVEVERLQGAAAAYETLKSRTASIELEAHSRAQAIEEEGRRKSRQAREELLKWFDELQGAYARMRSDVDTALGQTLRELEKAGQTMTGLSRSVTSQEETMKLLRSKLEDMEPQPPRPFSLGTEDLL